MGTIKEQSCMLMDLPTYGRPADSAMESTDIEWRQWTHD